MRNVMIALCLAAGGGWWLALDIAAGQERPEGLATIRVESEREGYWGPLGVELPEGVDWHAPFEMYVDGEGGEGERRIAFQIEAGKPPRLWLNGESGARYLLRRPSRSGAGSSDEPTSRRHEFRGPRPLLSIDAESLSIGFESDGRKPVLRYNHGYEQLPPGIGPAFLRSGFIHPVYSPAGKIVTDNITPDHAHHKGVWLAWVNTDYEGRHIDFWNIGGRTGTVRFAGYEGASGGPVYTGFRARHHHLDLTQDPDKLVIDETWDVRVYSTGRPAIKAKAGPVFSAYIWDLYSTQTNVSDSPLKLNQYRYGGLGVRFAREWVPNQNYEVLTSEGHTFTDAHTTRARWVAHSGKVDDEWATVIVMCHPSNERYPETIRSSATFGPFFNWAPVQIADWSFEPGATHRFRYRFLVYDGRIDAERAERAWRDFAHPPKVTIEVER